MPFSILTSKTEQKQRKAKTLNTHIHSRTRAASPTSGTVFGTREGISFRTQATKPPRPKSALFKILESIYKPLQRSNRYCSCARTMHLDKFLAEEDDDEPAPEWYKVEGVYFSNCYFCCCSTFLLLDFGYQ